MVTSPSGRAPSSPGGRNSLPGEDPVLSATSASRFAAEELRNVHDSVAASMQYNGAFTSQMRDTLTELTNLTGDLKRARSGLAGPPGASAGPSGDLHATGRAPMPDGPAAPSGEASRPRTFSEGRQMGGAVKMGDVTTGVARAGAKALYDRGTSWQQHGQWMTQYDASGNKMGSLNIHDPNTAETVASSERTTHRLTLASSALQKYGAGEGITGALGGTVARLAGPVGVAAGIAQQGLDKWGEQTEAGAEWRQIYGSDAGRYGISQRLGSTMAGISSFIGGTGRERGVEAYKKMAGMGLSGDALGQATDFDQQMYLQHGMSSDNSAAFVDMSRKTGESLASLAEKIEAVSTAAVSAGKNSEVAITQFQNLASSLTTGVSSQKGSTTTAANIVATFSGSLPKGLDTPENQQAISAGLSEQNIAMVAARTGQNPLDLMNRVATDTTGDVQGQVINASLTGVVDDICRIAGITREALAAEISQRFPGRNALNGDEQQVILSAHPGLDVYSIQQVFAANGYNFPQGQMLDMFFSQVMGRLDSLSGEHAQGPLDVAKAAMGGGSGSSPRIAGGGKALPAVSQQEAMANAYAGNSQPIDPLAEAIGITLPTSTQQQYGAQAPSGYTDYKKWVGQTGDRDKAVEALFSSENAKKISDFAGTGAGGATFQTSKGAKSLSEILNDPTLLAELDSGKMTIANKDANEAGMSVSELTHYSDSASSSSTPGGSSAGAASGGFTLTLTSQAQRIFGIVGPSAAQSSGVPDVGYVSPSGY